MMILCLKTKSATIFVDGCMGSFCYWYILFIISTLIGTTLDIVREYRFDAPMGSLCSVQDNSAVFNENSTSHKYHMNWFCSKRVSIRMTTYGRLGIWNHRQPNWFFSTACSARLTTKKASRFRIIGILCEEPAVKGEFLSNNQWPPR